MNLIIFDLDGTLVDSEGAGCQAFLDLLPELQADLDELIHLYRGRKLAAILADIETRIGRALPIGFETAYRRRVSAIFDSGLLPMAGAAQALDAITLPVCVASSAPRSKIEHALRLTGLSRFFDQRIFSSYDVGFWKPDPRLFLHAASAMKADPARCIVIEDSAVGVAAAISAGMTAVQYLPHPGERGVEGAAIIRDLRELTDKRLMQWIGNRDGCR